jgi:hypothetical protein
LILAESEECKNILSNKTGVQRSSRTAILHHALYHGSIASIFFPYSGLVSKSADRFF